MRESSPPAPTAKTNGAERTSRPRRAGALIFLMQAGFATLSAGSIRAKNVKNILLKNLLDAANHVKSEARHRHGLGARAARAAEWPRIIEARGRPKHDLPPTEASGAPACRGDSHLVVHAYRRRPASVPSRGSCWASASRTTRTATPTPSSARASPTSPSPARSSTLPRPTEVRPWCLLNGGSLREGAG